MAKIQPPKKKRSTKGDAPTLPSSTSPQTVNLNKGAGELVALNFKVHPSFRKEFRTYASEMDISMVDLLKHCFEYYKARS
ncbi:MAG: hypothetical protein AAF806_05195 [Bacteroidota bacterium]